MPVKISIVRESAWPLVIETGCAAKVIRTLGMQAFDFAASVVRITRVTTHSLSIVRDVARNWPTPESFKLTTKPLSALTEPVKAADVRLPIRERTAFHVTPSLRHCNSARLVIFKSTLNIVVDSVLKNADLKQFLALFVPSVERSFLHIPENTVTVVGD